MGATPGPSCPICRKEARCRADNAAFPFCSPKCKLVDLGRWLDGTYRVPGPPVESTLDPEAHDGEAHRNLDEEDE